MLQTIRERREYHEVVITVLILAVFQYRASIDMLIDIWGDRVIETQFRNNAAVREFCDTEAGDVKLRSSVAAQYILQKIADAGIVVDTLEHIARVADRNSGIGSYRFLIKNLMRFSDLQFVIPEQNRRNNVVRYYESIKNLDAAQRNPHFWLQYAIAAMVVEEYERAKSYFETAYSLAEARDRYDPFMIDNHFARFLLKTSIGKGVAEAFEAFRQARQIVQQQIQKERFHYPFRVALGYVEFFDSFESKMTKEQKLEVGRAAEYVLLRVKQLPEVRRNQRYVKKCAEAMAEIERRASRA